MTADLHVAAISGACRDAIRKRSGANPVLTALFRHADPSSPGPRIGPSAFFQSMAVVSVASCRHRCSVARYFDMIAGTSTGGIIALGLAHGRSASEIRDFYIKRGGKIFPPPTRIGRFVRLLRRGHRYAYERGPLQNELLDIFGDSVLGQARAVN